MQASLEIDGGSDLAGTPLETVLATIGAAEPSAGAGIAGPVALTLALACARKAVGVTLRRGASESLEALDACLALHQHRALAQAQRDALLFKAFLETREPIETQHLVDSANHYRQLVDDVGADLQRLPNCVAEIVQGDVTAALHLQRAAGAIASDLLHDARHERARRITTPQQSE